MKSLSQRAKLKEIRDALPVEVKVDPRLGRRAEVNNSGPVNYIGEIDAVHRCNDGSEYLHIDLGHGQGLKFVHPGDVTILEGSRRTFRKR